MKRKWLLLGLPAVLITSVIVGVAIDRPLALPVAVVDADKEATDSNDRLPEFDCEDRSVAPYVQSANTKAGHMEWLTRELRLTPEQVVSVSSVFDDSSYRADEFWRATRDRYCELRDRLRADIRAVLTAEQVVALERVIEERRLEREATTASRSGDGSDG